MDNRGPSGASNLVVETNEEGSGLGLPVEAEGP